VVQFRLKQAEELYRLNSLKENKANYLRLLSKDVEDAETGTKVSPVASLPTTAHFKKEPSDLSRCVC